MKPFVYKCHNCGNEWESDDCEETYCPLCKSVDIEIEEVHAD